MISAGILVRKLGRLYFVHHGQWIGCISAEKPRMVPTMLVVFNAFVSTGTSRHRPRPTLGSEHRGADHLHAGSRVASGIFSPVILWPVRDTQF